MRVQRATDFGCFSDCSFPPLPLASICRAAASPELHVFWFGQGCPFPCTDTGTIFGLQLPACPAASGCPSRFEGANLREWREALLVKPEGPEKIPNEDSVSISGVVCVMTGSREGPPLIDIVCAFTRGLRVLQLSGTCQPGRLSLHPGLHRGCKTSRPRPPSSQSRAPRHLPQPAAKPFLAAPHPLPQTSFPRPLPSGARRGREVALCPHGSGRRTGSRVEGGGDTRTLGCPRRLPPRGWGRGVSASQAAEGITQTPSHPSCQGTATAEAPGKTPPGLPNLALQKVAAGGGGEGRGRGGGGGGGLPGVIYPPGL